MNEFDAKFIVTGPCETVDAMTIRHVAFSILACLVTSVVVSTQQAATEAAALAFEPYEAVRVALAADKLDGIPDHATSLVSLTRAFGGPDAEKAADRLRQATDLKVAREAFGVLSKALVPRFLEAKLPDVFGYQCSMVKLPWAQRGERVQNPYMGKSMSSCGERIRKSPLDLQANLKVYNYRHED
jgi:hypothetical protein